MHAYTHVQACAGGAWADLPARASLRPLRSPPSRTWPPPARSDVVSVDCQLELCVLVKGAPLQYPEA